MAVLNPRFHGNGFVQVYLTPDTRLHIWTPYLPATRVQNARIHDHRFLFESTVLVGALIQTEFEVTPDDERGPHGLYQQGAGHSDKSTPLEYVGGCHMAQSNQYRIFAGETYRFGGPNKYHDSSPADGELAVSLMRKVNVVDGYRARMVALNDEKPDHAFENQPDEEILRKVCREVLSGLF